MSKIVWDSTGQKRFETGDDHGVLYLLDGTGAYSTGVAWNGLTAVTESPSGADVTDLWADNIKYASLRAAETYGGTIEAYTYPDEFAECDGSASIGTGATIGQQTRKKFGFSFRTRVGNDIDPEVGYKLHLVYGCSASPSDRSYQTVNESPDAITFSWEFTTDPVNVTGKFNNVTWATEGETFSPTSCVILDSTKVPTAKMAAIEAILYGTDGVGTSTGTAARLPLPDEVASILNAA